MWKLCVLLPLLANAAIHIIKLDQVPKYRVEMGEITESEPLVSVLMPVHNRDELLRKSAQSILDQSYRNVELIILDDASTNENTK